MKEVYILLAIGEDRYFNQTSVFSSKSKALKGALEYKANEENLKELDKSELTEVNVIDSDKEETILLVLQKKIIE
jgi:hypothetical protein